MGAELDGELNTTMAAMVDDPHLLNLASGTGGVGAAQVRSFHANDLIGQFFPPDVEFIPISRTIDGERLVDELVIRFTHDRVISHLMPAVAPTGRSVELALGVVVGCRSASTPHLDDWQPRARADIGS
jgi:carboxymethylenebutenolidase